MKKQVLGILAALFVFMVLLPVGVHAADNVYAILYTDGLMVFQHGYTAEPGRTVAHTYPVDLTAVYVDMDSEGVDTPWYDERESVRIVSFADKISPISTAGWFVGCSNLQLVDNIQNLDTSNVTSMLGMFAFCSSLKTLDLSHFDTINVTNMGAMFYECSSLKTLDLSCFDTSNVTIMASMFESCEGLTALNLSNFNTANVTSMENMFFYCTKLAELNVSHFNTVNVTNMRNMFCGCFELAKLDLSHFDTSKVTDMSNMFANRYYHNKLKTIYVSDKFTTVSVTYGGNMFENCKELIGGNGTTFDTSHTDAAYARIDTPNAPGYFTAAVSYAITAATPDKAAGTLSVTLTNPNAVTVALSYFNANGQFMSANVRGVPADAGTVTLGLSTEARKACVMLFDGAYRPLCGRFEANIA